MPKPPFITPPDEELRDFRTMFIDKFGKRRYILKGTGLSYEYPEQNHRYFAEEPAQIATDFVEVERHA